MATTTTTASHPRAKIGVIFYSTYGHISTMAEKVIEGVESTGAEVFPYFM